MLQYEPLSGILRWYAPPDAAAPRGDHVASCCVVWRTHPNDVELRGLTGAMTRSRWRDLLAWLQSCGVQRLHAERVAGHILPLARPGPNGWHVIEIAALRARFDGVAASG